jgi:hypothetical protein
MPTQQGKQTHSIPTHHFSNCRQPLRARPDGHCRPIAGIRRIPLLPDHDRLPHLTRWPEVTPMADMTAEIVAKAFYTTWVSRFGCPRKITTDQRRQFEAVVTPALTRLMGIQRFRTTAYRPQSNGIIERWHRTIKAAIMCRENPNWTVVLPSVLLGLRAAIKEDIQCSPAELTLGTELRLPGEFFLDSTDNTTDPTSFV